MRLLSETPPARPIYSYCTFCDESFINNTLTRDVRCPNEHCKSTPTSPMMNFTSPEDIENFRKRIGRNGVSNVMPVDGAPVDLQSRGI